MRHLGCILPLEVEELMCRRLFTMPTIPPRPSTREQRGRSWKVLRWFAALVLTATAAAQQESTDLSQASLEELSNIQVYSASKHMQSASDAPASVTVVTADEIQKYGYRNLADILRSVPGFYVTYDRDYTFVGVRGFGRLGDWNSRILVLIDGHRINNNVLGQAMLGNEFLVDVDMIDRVEIVRGPSSSLYGANAFFAVINVITRTAKQVKDWELSFQTGALARMRAERLMAINFGAWACSCPARSITARARLCFFLNSTLLLTITALPETPTMKLTSTFWPR
jgi:outer membrane receptor for ferrienterochelin and colicin